MNANASQILVVDDDEASRIYCARQLRQYHLSVTTAMNGQEAIQLLQQQVFDLLLLDIVMPEMSGFEVLGWLKAEPRLRAMPVIVTSSLDDLDSLVRCIELGAEDYLFKPVNPVLLKARVLKSLERYHLRAQEAAYLEQLQIEKAAAEQASRAKSVFLSSITHELRTPLNAIIGYAEILREDLQAVAAELTPDVEKIRASGRHLLTIINNILDLAKLEAERMDMYLEEFDVPALIQDIVASMQPAIAKQGNQLQVDCPAEIGSIHADLNKVRQILSHLLDNAAKFTDHGQITLTVRKQPPSATAPSLPGPPDDSVLPPALLSTPYLMITIGDTGRGLSPDIVEHLFEPFSQGDDPTMRKVGGTGLGLALSQRFCQLMGGTITAHSPPDHGAQFTVYLPVDVIDHQVTTVMLPRDRTDGVVSDTTRVSDQAGLILVIDDDRSVRDQLVHTLNQDGLRVVTTWNGEEGLRLARELHPDLIIMDMVLPTIDSWAVLAALKADANVASIPVLMTVLHLERNLGLTLGLADLLTKPTDFRRLALLLRQYEPEPLAATPAKTVLLIERDATLQQMLSRLLEKEGWSVTALDHPRLAQATIERQRPACIVLDLQLPNVAGLEFIAHVRQHPEWHQIPLLTLATKDLSKADRLWFNGYIETLFQDGGSSTESTMLEVRQLVAFCTQQPPPIHSLESGP